MSKDKELDKSHVIGLLLGYCKPYTIWIFFIVLLIIGIVIKWYISYEWGRYIIIASVVGLIYDIGRWKGYSKGFYNGYERGLGNTGIDEYNSY